MPSTVEVIGSCDLPDIRLGTDLGPLQEQYTLSTTEPPPEYWLQLRSNMTSLRTFCMKLNMDFGP